MNREPVTVAGAAIVVVTTGIDVAALILGLDAGLKTALSGFGTAVVVFIALAWARSRSTPVSDPILPSGTMVSVQGTEDAVIIAPNPPGPVAVEGGADPNGDDDLPDPFRGSVSG
jgi:hypothetical protein